MPTLIEKQKGQEGKQETLGKKVKGYQSIVGDGQEPEEEGRFAETRWGGQEVGEA